MRKSSPHNYWLTGFCLQDCNSNSSSFSVLRINKIFFIADPMEHSVQKYNSDFNVKQFYFKMSLSSSPFRYSYLFGSFSRIYLVIEKYIIIWSFIT